MREAITGTLGLDLGDRRSYAYALDAATGEVLSKGWVKTSRQSFEEFFAGMPPMRVVMETGSNSPWASRVAARHGHRVIVAQSRRLRAIYENPRKSDQVDAQMLAELGATRPSLLHPIRHRGEEAQAHLAVVRARDVVVTSRTQFVNAVRGLAKSMGYQLPRCSTESFHRKAWDEVPVELAPALRPLLLVIARLTRTIRRYEREISLLCRKHKDATRLAEVAGVGNITALTYVLTIDDPRRFAKSREVGAYLGLVPRRDQSGGTERQLRISKTGDAALRRLLVCCAQQILGPFGADTDLRRWGLVKAERGGGNGKKRAVVAVARKLAVLLHRIWVSGEAYRPLRAAA
jgi:transposase